MPLVNNICNTASDKQSLTINVNFGRKMKKLRRVNPLAASRTVLQSNPESTSFPTNGKRVILPPSPDSTEAPKRRTPPSPIRFSDDGSKLPTSSGPTRRKRPPSPIVFSNDTGKRKPSPIRYMSNNVTSSVKIPKECDEITTTRASSRTGSNFEGDCPRSNVSSNTCKESDRKTPIGYPDADSTIKFFSKRCSTMEGDAGSSKKPKIEADEKMLEVDRNDLGMDRSDEFVPPVSPYDGQIVVLPSRFAGSLSEISVFAKNKPDPSWRTERRQITMDSCGADDDNADYYDELSGDAVVDEYSDDDCDETIVTDRQVVCGPPGNRPSRPFLKTHRGLPKQFHGELQPGRTAHVGAQAAYRFRTPDMRVGSRAASPIFVLFNIPFTIEIEKVQDRKRKTMVLAACVRCEAPRDKRWRLLADFRLTLLTRDGRFVLNTALLKENGVQLTHEVNAWGTDCLMMWSAVCQPHFRYLHDNGNLIVQFRMTIKASNGLRPNKLSVPRERRPVSPAEKRFRERLSEAWDSPPPSVPNRLPTKAHSPTAVKNDKERARKSKSYDESIPAFGPITKQDDDPGRDTSVVKTEVTEVPINEDDSILLFYDEGDLSVPVTLMVEWRKMCVLKDSLRRHFAFFRNIFTCMNILADSEIVYDLNDVKYEEFLEFLRVTFWKTRQPTKLTVSFLLELAMRFGNELVTEKCNKCVLTYSEAMDKGWMLYASERYGLKAVGEKALDELDTIAKVQEVTKGKFIGRLSDKLSKRVLLKICM